MNLYGDPTTCRRLGLAGSTTITVGGLACGALPVLSPAPQRQAGADLVAVYFGLALLIAAWWMLGSAPVAATGSGGCGTPL